VQLTSEVFGAVVDTGAFHEVPEEDGSRVVCAVVVR